MKLIKDLVSVKPTSGVCGVEIECEGRGLPVFDTDPIWRVDNDSSLRGGYEYVMRKPLDLVGTMAALHNLRSRFEKASCIIDEAVRAGVHVHFNVQEFTFNQLFNLITLHTLLEELLVDFCGEYRAGNLFCLRVKDAQYILMPLAKAARQRSLAPLESEVIRYAALNLCSLFKYGSVEFRAMRSTPDFSLYRTWIDILNELYEKAKVFENPQQIMDLYLEGTPVEFCYTVLGGLAETLLIGKDDSHVEECLNEAYLNALSFTQVKWPSEAVRKVGQLMFPADMLKIDEPLEDY